MSLDTRMAFERQQPSVELRAFLDPLKPGAYFDCGGARLYGIDEALEAEAVRRGRDVGGDDFQLVATDGGLIFCRASISFAIAARWKDLSIGRPANGETGGKVLLPIHWPTHGDLEFTVSRRLGSNVFRRWLQIQAQATRRNQLDHGGDDQQRHSMMTTSEHGLSSSAGVDVTPGVGFADGDTIDLRDSPAEVLDPHSFPDVGPVNNIDSHPRPDDGPQRFEDFDRGTNDPIGSIGEDVAAEAEWPLHGLSQGESTGSEPVADDFAPPAVVDDVPVDIPEAVEVEQTLPEEPPSEFSNPEAPLEISPQEPAQAELDEDARAGNGTGGHPEQSETTGWSEIDEELRESWVDDRQPSAGGQRRSLEWLDIGDEDPTSDPFEALRAQSSLSFNRIDERGGLAKRPPVETGLDPKEETTSDRQSGLSFEPRTQSARLDADGLQQRDTESDPNQETAPNSSDPATDFPDDPSATHFMPRTLAGTEVFPSGEPGGQSDISRGQSDDTGLQQPGSRTNVPVPEIQGARLQQSPAAKPEARTLGARSALLSGAQDSPLVHLFREWRLPILAAASVLALILLVIIGIVAGGGDSGETSATDSVTADGANGADTGDEAGVDSVPAAADPTSASETDTPETVLTTTTAVVEQSALVVSTSSVQICHSNYGGCVPVAADVDCEGDGDGPAFQSDAVAVFGDDVYDLDTDNDRQACEPGQPASSTAGG